MYHTFDRSIDLELTSHSGTRTSVSQLPCSRTDLLGRSRKAMRAMWNRSQLSSLATTFQTGTLRLDYWRPWHDLGKGRGNGALEQKWESFSCCLRTWRGWDIDGEGLQKSGARQTVFLNVFVLEDRASERVMVWRLVWDVLDRMNGIWKSQFC